MLCSVEMHAVAGSGLSLKEVYGKTRDVVECFSLDCYLAACLLSALQQNRAQPRLLHLFYDKQSVKIPHAILSNFSKQKIGRWRDSFSSMFYTRIKHAFSAN